MDWDRLVISMMMSTHEAMTFIVCTILFISESIIIFYYNPRLSIIDLECDDVRITKLECKTSIL